SPLDITLLRRFAASSTHSPGEPLWEIMRLVGTDLLDYIKTLRARLTFIAQHAQLWTLDELASANLPQLSGLRSQVSGPAPAVLFLPRTDPLPEEPSSGLDRYVAEQGLENRVVALIAPDRRSSGYG